MSPRGGGLIRVSSRDRESPRMLRSRLTYANVVATLALFIALGGTSVAASSLISGSKIKKDSIPGDRLKKHALTSTQVNVAKLGTIPRAATADTAGHASDADALGGLSAAAFTRTERFQVGSADSRSTTVKTLLDYPDMGLRIETDGTADFDDSVILHNTGTATLTLVGDSGFGNVFAGQKSTLVQGSTGLASQPDETLFLVQETPGRDEVLIAVASAHDGRRLRRAATWCLARGAGGVRGGGADAGRAGRARNRGPRHVRRRRGAGRARARVPAGVGGRRGRGRRSDRAGARDRLPELPRPGRGERLAGARDAAG